MDHASGPAHASIDTPARAKGGTDGGRLRVVFVLRQLVVGGGNIQAEMLGRGLRDAGHEVTFVVLSGGGALEPKILAEGFTVISLDKRHRWDAGVAPRLARVLRRLRPDVIHAWLPLSDMLCIGLKPLLPGAIVVASVHTARRDLSSLTRLERISHWLTTRTVRFADVVLVNSTGGYEELRTLGRVPVSRLALVPNAVDVGTFHRDELGGLALRGAWGVEASHLLFGLVATRLEPLKGHDLFVQAAGEIRTVAPEARFVCFGEGSPERLAELSGLAARAGLTDLIVWAGVRSDMPAVYSAMDILVCASYAEGGPNVVIEAMACGTPCVVTDVGHAKEMVGATGECVAVGDAAALAKAMRGTRERLHEDGQGLRLACQVRANREFGLPRYVEQVLAAYSLRRGTTLHAHRSALPLIAGSSRRVR